MGTLRTQTIRLAATFPADSNARQLLLATLKSADDGTPARWSEFLDARYDGGSKKVPNTNPDTRDRYESVAMTTLMKNDESFRKKVQKEYEEWASKDSEKSEKSDKSKKSEKAEAEPLPNKPEAWNEYGDLHTPEREKWTADQREAVRVYTTSADKDYIHINAHLRDPDSHKELTDKQKKAMEGLDSLFEAHAVKQPVVASRGLSKSHALTKLFNSGNLEVGTTVEDPGYVSTSIKPWAAHDWATSSPVKLNIVVPKGAKAIYVGPPDKPPPPFSGNPHEYELLLNRGTKFKVTAIDREKKTIDVEVLP